jgi:hypothetical protein
MGASPKTKVGLRIGLAVLLVVMMGGGYLAYKRFLNEPEVEPSPQPQNVSRKKKEPATNTTPATSETVSTPAPKAAKSAQDLKTGTVSLEKSKGGSSLVYGVGEIRNESDYQRFGVKVELNVFDAAGKNAGKATDYIQVIEPHGSWRFHALILDPKATSAKIANVSEAE